MTTDRQRRLLTLWSWLPAFRAVAEVEHLPTASKELAISPSALSRSIRLIEEELGQELFDRIGRNLRLNHHGLLLLEALRDSMRQLDDALEAVVSGEPRGPIRLSATTSMLSFVLEPAIAELRATYPGVEPWILPPGATSEVNDDLLAGRLDLALLQIPLPHPDLRAEKLFDLDYGVYCGPRHPLYEIEDPPPIDQVLGFEFTAPTIAEANRFPPDLQPNVVMRVFQMSVAVEFCASGRYLVVLPSRVARSYPGPPLWRVPGISLEPGALYLVTRAPLGTPNPTVEALAAILRRVAR